MQRHTGHETYLENLRRRNNVSKLVAAGLHPCSDFFAQAAVFASIVLHFVSKICTRLTKSQLTFAVLLDLEPPWFTRDLL